jgi:type II secretory pathway pseudopilin PulG
LIELLIVVVLGSVVVLAAYQVLTSNSQAYSGQNAKIEAMHTTRSSLDILVNEIREISVGGGDFHWGIQDRFLSRILRAYGIICTLTTSGGPLTQQNLNTVTTLKLGEGFTSGDSVWVFAENDSTTTTDDDWIRAQLSGVTETTCQSRAAQVLSFQSTTPFDGDTVRLGSPVRSFHRILIGTTNSNGGVFIGRVVGSGGWEILAGPVSSLGFVYLDSMDNVAISASRVHSIEVTIVVDTDVPNVADTLSTRIYLRN